MYFINVMNNVFNNNYLKYQKDKYHHFESIEGVFYNRNHKYRSCSTNSFAIDTERLNDDFRITRFIRDPRDLIISGYFYHKRGAEPWFRMKRPSNKYWSPINGNLPQGMLDKPDYSYAEYLSSLDLEEGLLAEMEFRKFHFESMRLWKEDSRIRIFKYENIIFNEEEEEVFNQIAEHLELSSREKRRVKKYAEKFSLKNQGKNKHVKNPKSNQWKENFTDKVTEVFNKNYGDLLDLYDYTP